MSPKAKIMVIEDDVYIAELVRYNLEQERYAVTILANGTNGAACVAREKPDLVILFMLQKFLSQKPSRQAKEGFLTDAIRFFSALSLRRFL